MAEVERLELKCAGLEGRCGESTRALERWEEREREREREREVEKELEKRRNASNPAPIDMIVEKIAFGSKQNLAWYGVSSMTHFYLTVKEYLKPIVCQPPLPRDFFRQLQRSLVLLRVGFPMKVAQPMMEPHRGGKCVRRVFNQTMEQLYPWALTQITLPTPTEWLAMNTEKLEKGFPNRLFFFIDGTILEVWRPKDIKRARSDFNAKHGCAAVSFFIVVSPTGRIVYISHLDTGNTHDSTSWNLAPAFPPTNVTKIAAEKRTDGETFIMTLQKYYGVKGIAKTLQDIPLEVFFAIGGDKAYPFILLPNGWYLYVTASSSEEDAQKEAKEGQEATEKALGKLGGDRPVFNKDDEKMRNLTPDIARPRGVVERVIGAMKDFHLLLNVPFLSRQNYRKVVILIFVVAAITNYNLAYRGTSW
jgi:hypothetical protein